MRFKDSSRTIRLLGKAFVATCASLLIAGCGGSGSGGVSAVSYTLPTVSSTPAAIGSSTQAGIAIDVTGGTSGATSSGGGGVTGVSTSGGTSTVTQPVDDAMGMATKLISDAMAGPQSAAGVTASTSGSCPYGGTMNITADLSSGDYVVQFNSCGLSNDGGMTTYQMDGSISATGVSTSGTRGSFPFTFSATFSYSLTIAYTSGATISATGTYDVSLNADSSTNVFTTTLSNGQMGMSNGTFALVMSKIKDTKSCDATYGYNGSTLQCLGTATINDSFTLDTANYGEVTVTTPTPLQVARWNNAIYPNAGVISATSSDGSSLTITASDDDVGTNGVSPVVVVAWDNGAGVTGTQSYTSWTSLAF